MAKGDFKFTLHGEKLRGLWVLVRLKPRPGEKRDNWLLIKEKDEFVRPREEYDVTAEEPDSVLGASGDGGGSGDEFSARRDGPMQATAPASIPADLPAPPASAPAKPGDLHPSAGAVLAPFPSAVDLQLATLVDTPPEGDEWVAEVKYDGYRVALTLEAGRGQAFTRSHADWSERFSGLTRAMTELPADSAVIDGEAVVFDSDGISRFGLLQKALGPHPEKVAYSAFDLLYLNGYDLSELPLTQRKELLQALLAEQPATSPIRYADHVVGGGSEFYKHACLADLEGVVCKRANSRHTPGRGREWVKIKCRQSQELVVGGFTEGAGSRAALGSVLVGTYDGERLIYAGRVGSGLDEATVTSLRARLDALEVADSPFDPPPHITGHVVHFTRPELVIEAAFREWTAEGVLRQPVFLGIREDKAATEVIRERPEEATALEGLQPRAERGHRERRRPRREDHESRQDALS
jgi:bifunctional non-homologous end joining protein LigD